MNLEKTGKFIAELRKEKNMSQQELADLIPVSREAISKWERGKNGADNSSLLRLSEIFNVSINEIFYGERKNKNNKDSINRVSLDIYSKTKVMKKSLILTIVLLVLIILTFLLYYFFGTYNSLKVFIISYSSDDFIITDGLFVTTKDKLYFNISNIDSEYEIKGLGLYYKNDKNSKLIYHVDDDYIILYDFYKYNKYFEYNNLSNIINNLYLKIETNEGEEMIKLNLKEDFSNNKISVNHNKVTNDKKDSFENNNDMSDLINMYNLNNENPYIVKIGEEEINLAYFSVENCLRLEATKNGERKIWLYYSDYEYIDFSYYINNKLIKNIAYNSDTDLIDNKENLKEFYEIINELKKK